jgi:hypothetical protein
VIKDVETLLDQIDAKEESSLIKKEEVFTY